MKLCINKRENYIMMHGPLNVKVFKGFMKRILLNYHSATVVIAQYDETVQ